MALKIIDKWDFDGVSGYKTVRCHSRKMFLFYYLGGICSITSIAGSGRVGRAELCNTLIRFRAHLDLI